MTIKEFLSRGFTIKREINAKREHLERLKQQRLCLPGGGASERVQSSPNLDKYADLSVAYMDACDELAREYTQLLIVEHEIKTMIETVPNPDYRVLLYERYINCKTWEKIAYEMEYNWRTVHKRHKRALECLMKLYCGKEGIEGQY